MRPVRHAGSNVVYRGPTEDIGDLWCERATVEGHPAIKVVYELDDEEREMLICGGRIELSLLTEPIPPLMMEVLPEKEKQPIGEHGWRGQSTDDVPDSVPEDYDGS